MRPDILKAAVDRQFPVGGRAGYREDLKNSLQLEALFKMEKSVLPQKDFLKVSGKKIFV